MKILTEEEIKGQQHATLVGGAKGFFGGLGVALPASYIAHKRWPYYRTLPPSIKALGVVSIVVPSFVICAEQASHAFERSQWKGIGKQELDMIKTAEELRWESLTTTDKIKDWSGRHKWGIILGSWATSMAGSFGIIMRDPHQTFSQKIVQARMWAQGLTLGVVIASAVLSSQSRKNVDIYHPQARPDHSWAIAVAAEKNNNDNQ
ncbi:hypothetical protein Clacol_001421 [Clathrus columnatus]|uniref:HIG1 domain-containing protein n=1 Tax=Clathrus columnatus TaxID=1419009 RepID=A0AAV5A3R6_9AGAM|nr:hypothetical protein Clacol_001421 [Clathrus columnatus]